MEMKAFGWAVQMDNASAYSNQKRTAQSKGATKVFGVKEPGMEGALKIMKRNEMRKEGKGKDKDKGKDKKPQEIQQTPLLQLLMYNLLQTKI